MWVGGKRRELGLGEKGEGHFFFFLISVLTTKKPSGRLTKKGVLIISSGELI